MTSLDRDAQRRMDREDRGKLPREFHRPPCVKANGTKKKPYPSRAAAEKGARDTRRGNLRDPRLVHAYHCPACGFWHVGHYDAEAA